MAKPKEPWDKMRKEPELWFERFNVYRALVPAQRSILATFRAFKANGALNSATPGSNWYVKSKDWNWKERAAAYDAYIRERVRGKEDDLHMEAHEDRIRMLQALLPRSYYLLQHAMEHMTAEMVQKQFGTIARVFVSMLQEYRLELTSMGIDLAQGQEVPSLDDAMSAAIDKAYTEGALKKGAPVNATIKPFDPMQPITADAIDADASD